VTPSETVIDEAPRVFEAHVKAARYVEKILEEMRKYGEGLILVARYPKLSDIVLRETNQKISHRVIESKDVNQIAHLLDMTREEKKLLTNLPRGLLLSKRAQTLRSLYGLRNSLNQTGRGRGKPIDRI